MSKTPATYQLFTYGCQMNEYDSELIASLLGNAGYRRLENGDSADIVLFNTCAVRESANTRVYAHIEQWSQTKREGKAQVIGILGCIPQNLKGNLLERFPEVDFVCGPDSYRSLPTLITNSAADHERSVEARLSEYETYSDIAPVRVPGVNAWLAIMRGCDKFCSFCVVPFTRGRERSRTPESIVDETRQLVADGYKQVTLLGQNVNSYRSGETDFASLIDQVGNVEGIERVRFTSPHPNDFPVHLLEVIAANPQVCSHIHFPLQAGSNRVLEQMHREYTIEEFLKLVKLMRETIPGVTLTTDIICGFPTETDAEYQETVAAVKEIEFDAAFIFKYSEREGTLAARRYPDDLPEEVKSARVTDLVGIQRKISERKNREMIGRTCRVLVEGRAKKSADQLKARTDGNKIVLFPAVNDLEVGDFCDVTITDVTPNTLLGRLL